MAIFGTITDARSIVAMLIALLAIDGRRIASAAVIQPPAVQERMFEWTVESHKAYADPFNDVDVDVIFTHGGQTWRVPMFWRGGQRWTVRFAPSAAGDYAYRLESTDPTNVELNGHEGHVKITAYGGPSDLLRHGPLRVSANGRYFEHADGTPFYWLGDTWWTGLSDRLSWKGFQKLTADRQAKGFTLIQIVAGLIPPEEQAPVDPGFRNEGGAVWDPEFKRINPRYFDYADRRIQFLLDHGMVPAIVGAWNQILRMTGLTKMKQHWRYVIARYGAYPVFWIVGGEVLDPSEAISQGYSDDDRASLAPGWTEVARYIRAIDPYRHPLSAHEAIPPWDTPLRDESLTDFDLFQSGHYGWSSIGIEVAQLNQHYSRTQITKPIVEGEIGYEKLGESHFEDFQRTAFWLSMLNGAAGHTYGANGTFEAYTGDKPLHRLQYSFLTWEEGMSLPGSYQIGLASKLLRQYQWWRFAPHPEWVTPRGTTLLEPHTQVVGFAFGSPDPEPCVECEPGDRVAEIESSYVAAEWKERHGTFRLPYAGGIPREVRFIYVPAVGLKPLPAPTVLGLETGVRYHAYWWEPSFGTRIDLGAIERPRPAAVLFDGSSLRTRGSAWKEDHSAAVLKGVKIANAVVRVDAESVTGAGLVLRFQDVDDHVAATYSARDQSLRLIERRGGIEHRLSGCAVPTIGPRITLSAEVRDDQAVASVTDGEKTYTTSIVNLHDLSTGTVGFLRGSKGAEQLYRSFQLRASPTLVKDTALQRSLYDAKDRYRGELLGGSTMIDSLRVPPWDDLGRVKHILLDAYRPDRLPTTGDWVLVLAAKASDSHQ